MKNLGITELLISYMKGKLFYRMVSNDLFWYSTKAVSVQMEEQGRVGLFVRS